jgi:hypothetical protein
VTLMPVRRRTRDRRGKVPHFDVRDWTFLEYFDSRPLETDLL